MTHMYNCVTYAMIIKTILLLYHIRPTKISFVADFKVDLFIF